MKNGGQGRTMQLTTPPVHAVYGRFPPSPAHPGHLAITKQNVKNANHICSPISLSLFLHLVVGRPL